MTIDDVKNYLGLKNDSDLIPVLDVTKGTISKWRHTGIKDEMQAVIQIRTGNELKSGISADLKQKETA